MKPANEDTAADCVVFYAQRARNQGIVIYTITLGNAADAELMSYVAELTGGEYFHAEQPSDLDARFAEIYKRILVRLIH